MSEFSRDYYELKQINFLDRLYDEL